MPQAGITYGPTIPAPDYKQIAQDAKDAAKAELAAIVPKPGDAIGARYEDLLVRSAEIVRQADADLAVYLPERDQALTHLWCYEPRRSISRSAGITPVAARDSVARTLFDDKTRPLPEAASNEERAAVGDQFGVPRKLDGVEDKLVEAAKIVVAAHARRQVAAEFMHDAVLVLSEKPFGWKPERIAELAGVDRDLIYRQRTTARKRAGLHVPRSATI